MALRRAGPAAALGALAVAGARRALLALLVRGLVAATARRQRPAPTRRASRRSAPTGRTRRPAQPRRARPRRRRRPAARQPAGRGRGVGRGRRLGGGLGRRGLSRGRSLGRAAPRAASAAGAPRRAPRRGLGRGGLSDRRSLSGRLGGGLDAPAALRRRSLSGRHRLGRRGLSGRRRGLGLRLTRVLRRGGRRLGGRLRGGVGDRRVGLRLRGRGLGRRGLAGLRGERARPRRFGAPRRAPERAAPPCSGAGGVLGSSVGCSVLAHGFAPRWGVVVWRLGERGCAASCGPTARALLGARRTPCRPRMMTPERAGSTQRVSPQYADGPARGARDRLRRPRRTRPRRRSATSPSAGIRTAAAAPRPTRGWPRSTPRTTSCGPPRGPSATRTATAPGPRRSARRARAAGAGSRPRCAARSATSCSAALEPEEDVWLVTPASTWASPTALLAATDRRLLWLLDDAVVGRVGTLRFTAVEAVEHSLRRPLKRVATLRVRDRGGRRHSFGDLRPDTAATLHRRIAAALG